MGLRIHYEKLVDLALGNAPKYEDIPEFRHLMEQDWLPLGISSYMHSNGIITNGHPDLAKRVVSELEDVKKFELGSLSGDRDELLYILNVVVGRTPASVIPFLEKNAYPSYDVFMIYRDAYDPNTKNPLLGCIQWFIRR
jgi:hypothetical protein